MKEQNYSKSVTCKICFLQDHTGDGCDLSGGVHAGFTIGKGKKLYWEMIWHASSGNVTVYPLEYDKS